MPQESINLRGIPLAWYIFFCQKIYTTQGKEKIMKFLKIVEEIQNKPENIDHLVLILSPVAESRKCFNCAKCSWNVKQNHNLIDEKIAKIKNL